MNLKYRQGRPILKYKKLSNQLKVKEKITPEESERLGELIKQIKRNDDSRRLSKTY